MYCVESSLLTCWIDGWTDKSPDATSAINDHLLHSSLGAKIPDRIRLGSMHSLQSIAFGDETNTKTGGRLQTGHLRGPRKGVAHFQPAMRCQPLPGRSLCFQSAKPNMAEPAKRFIQVPGTAGGIQHLCFKNQCVKK